MILELLRRHGDLTRDEPGMTKQSPLDSHHHTISNSSAALSFGLQEVERDEYSSKEFLKLGLTCPFQSSWSSPAILVVKKDGSKHLCVDYCRLNEVTSADPFPLPHINDLLNQFGAATFISTYDLIKSYHQVLVDTDSISKTAFVTPVGI